MCFDSDVNITYRLTCYTDMMSASLPLPAGMDKALEDTVCQDDRHLQRQRWQLCRLLGEQIKEAFYAPTLTVIADQEWDQAMLDMKAAVNKDAKKR